MSEYEDDHSYSGDVLVDSLHPDENLRDTVDDDTLHAQRIHLQLEQVVHRNSNADQVNEGSGSAIELEQVAQGDSNVGPVNEGSGSAIELDQVAHESVDGKNDATVIDYSVLNQLGNVKRDTEFLLAPPDDWQQIPDDEGSQVIVADNLQGDIAAPLSAIGGGDTDQLASVMSDTKRLQDNPNGWYEIWRGPPPFEPPRPPVDMPAWLIKALEKGKKPGR